MRPPRIRRRGSGTKLRRGIYIIPSLFTVANMFCGFLSMAYSSRGRMETAALFILAAGFADVLDGRIARLTGTTSSFGESYDSLADVISFGAAPALLAFHWGLWEVPRIGMACAFLFLAAGSIRLARFSTNGHDMSRFQGLPIPAGAGAITMLVLVSPEPVMHPAFIPVVVCFVVAVALLMVSNLPYRSFKDMNLKRQWPAPTLFAIAVVFSLVTLDPRILSILLAVYILSAPVMVLSGRLRKSSQRTAPVTPRQRTEFEEDHESSTDPD
ncbi:MAG: CDP-diacylglycerol--serine O-phosphatidyltransferase [bacterium]|nr:CDP-diacylglycerol--serine O-phosphatidyltransferase [bacterium]